MTMCVGALILMTVAVNRATGYKYDEPARCNIKLKAYSIVDPCPKPVEGYAQLNGRTVWEAGWCSSLPNIRGVTIMTVNPITCTAGDIYTFDTWLLQDAATDLVNYLNWLPGESIIVGVSGDEPTRYLSAAFPLLKIAGVQVSDVRSRGNFAFVLQKGYPKKTQFVKSITNGVPISKLSVNVVGSSTEDLQIVLISKYSVR